MKFCPDNTCEIFDVKSGALSDEYAEQLFVLYLAQFSGYSHLRSVNEDRDVKKLSEEAISLLKVEACSNLKGLPKLKCILQSEEKLGRLAEGELLPIYGDRIFRQRPFKAVLRDGIWIVEGTLAEGREGGTALVKVRKSTGEIVSLTHGK